MASSIFHVIIFSSSKLIKIYQITQDQVHTYMFKISATNDREK